MLGEPWRWCLDPAADSSPVLHLSGSWRMQDSARELSLRGVVE